MIYKAYLYTETYLHGAYVCINLLVHRNCSTVYIRDYLYRDYLSGLCIPGLFVSTSWTTYLGPNYREYYIGLLMLGLLPVGLFIPGLLRHALNESTPRIVHASIQLLHLPVPREDYLVNRLLGALHRTNILEYI